jgi:hypothetical protein
MGVAEELAVDVEVFTGAAMPDGSVPRVEEVVIATEEGTGEELAVEVKVFTGAAIPDGSMPVVVDDEVLAEVAVSTGAAVAVGDVLVAEAPGLDEEVLGVVDEEIPEVARRRRLYRDRSAHWCYNPCRQSSAGGVRSDSGREACCHGAIDWNYRRR